MSPLPIAHLLTIPSSDLNFRAVRASGPGGQNVNKVSSKVELRFDVHGTRVLDDATKLRLFELAGQRRIARDGSILIVSADTRDQARNLSFARMRLAELVRQALHTPEPRKATSPTLSAKKRRVADKRAHGDRKRARLSARLADSIE